MTNVFSFLDEARSPAAAPKVRKSFPGLPLDIKAGSAYFVSGIDTEAGKSICTGYLARLLNEKGLKCSTMKFIQTGCGDFSDDIIRHRAVMDREMDEFDLDGTSAPVILKFPASPALAAKMQGEEIDFKKISDSIEKMTKVFDVVLIEGAGGLMVPLEDEAATLDWIEASGLPLVLVAGGRLGSINHALLSLSAVKERKIPLALIAFNEFGMKGSEEIFADALENIERFAAREFPGTPIIKVPRLDLAECVEQLPLYK